MGTLLDKEWLRNRLLAMGFNPPDVHKNIESCLHHLRSHDIFHREEAIELFEDEETFRELRDIYKHCVRRSPVTIDPVGLCCWGPMLFKSAHRSLMALHVRNMINVHDEPKRNLQKLIDAASPSFRRIGA